MKEKLKMEMITLSMALIISLVCVIFWAILKNMLLKAELRGSYTAGARQPRSMDGFHTEPSMNASSNVGLFFFVSFVVVFFGYIAISMAWSA